jgi:diacylglycerol kinase (ATP)
VKFKHIHFIINPASGKEEPVLSYINQAFLKSKIRWDVSVTQKHCGASEIANGLIGKTNLIVVYGGDGCVTEVAAALHGSGQPMGIIPGGTANVMAKELGIPTDTLEALTTLKSGKLRLKSIDMGLANNQPFLLRVNLGIMADMITSAHRELKNNLGQLAYGVTAIQTVASAKAINYHLKIDGKKVAATGVALTITNSGSMGIGDFALQPGISISDGQLDVILMNDNNFVSLFKAAGSALLQTQTDVLQHWPCKTVQITMDKKQTIIIDDLPIVTKKLKIKVIPAAIQILCSKK